MSESNSRRREFSASIRHLKVFESVAHLQGFQRASEECHLSQPAVTQAIAKLEEQLGVSLLVRRASGSYLNEIGVVFHRRMQRLFAQMEQALLEVGVPNGPIPASQLTARISRSQIRSLIAIAENGSFAQAARALGISQTSLQRSARDLERILRIPLYNQTAAGVVAAQSAVEFARKLKLAMREIDWGVDEVEAARGNIGGEIVVGAMLLSGSVVIASVIDEFVSTYSNAEVRIINGNTEDLLKELRTGDVDVVIGLLRQQRSEGLIHRPLAETPYAIVGRHGHPLTEKSPVTLDDLCGFDWVIGTPGSSRRARFDKLFAGRQRPRARIETSSLPTIRMLLSQSDRLTLLTSYELMYEEDALAAVPFGPIEPVPCIGLTMRENWLPTQLQTSFIELVQKRIVGSLMPIRNLRRAASGAHRGPLKRITEPK
jgi:LysR family transcriptional regulator, regulator for genes of the gallate degradation pathway